MQPSNEIYIIISIQSLLLFNSLLKLSTKSLFILIYMQNKNIFNQKYLLINQVIIHKDHIRTIFRVQNKITNSKCLVVQIIHDPQNQNSQFKLVWLERQIQILKKCKNQNIIRFIQYFAVQNKIYIILQNAQQTLETYLKKMKPNIVQSYHIFKQLASALYYLNKFAKVTVKDLRPCNIMVYKDTWKLISLGFVFSENIQQNNQSINFQSPQIISKKEQINYKSDIWSLGILFYRILFQQYPFNINGIQNRLNQIKQQHLVFPKNFEQSSIRQLMKNLLKCNNEQRSGWEEIFEKKLIGHQLIIYEEDLNYELYKQLPVQLKEVDLEQFFSQKDTDRYYNYMRILKQMIKTKNKVELYHYYFIYRCQQLIFKYFNDVDRSQRKILLIALLQMGYYIKQIDNIEYRLQEEIDDEQSIIQEKKSILMISNTISSIKKPIKIKRKELKIETLFKTKIARLSQIISKKINKYSESNANLIQEKSFFNVYVQNLKQIKTKIQLIESNQNDFKQKSNKLYALIDFLSKNQNDGFLQTIKNRKDITQFLTNYA